MVGKELDGRRRMPERFQGADERVRASDPGEDADSSTWRQLGGAAGDIEESGGPVDRVQYWDGGMNAPDDRCDLVERLWLRLVCPRHDNGILAAKARDRLAQQAARQQAAK